MSTITIPANYYQHYDCDFNMDIPAEGMGGWKKGNIQIDLQKTAIVVMHAWELGTNKQFPGLYRHIEYIPRAQEITRNIFPNLLKAVRSSEMKVYHVVGGGDYYKNYPGYLKAKEMAPDELPLFGMAQEDPVLLQLRELRKNNSLPGPHNTDDPKCIFDFSSEALPYGNEGIAENGDQLAALCNNDGVNNLIYIGFAINVCLLLLPGGMQDMNRRGFLCSTIREAVTAVENKETARSETVKEVALWYVGAMYGFVYNIGDFMKAIKVGSINT